MKLTILYTSALVTTIGLTGTALAQAPSMQGAGKSYQAAPHQMMKRPVYTPPPVPKRPAFADFPTPRELARMTPPNPFNRRNDQTALC